MIPAEKRISLRVTGDVFTDSGQLTYLIRKREFWCLFIILIFVPPAIRQDDERQYEQDAIHNSVTCIIRRRVNPVADYVAQDIERAVCRK